MYKHHTAVESNQSVRQVTLGPFPTTVPRHDRLSASRDSMDHEKDWLVRGHENDGLALKRTEQLESSHA